MTSSDTVARRPSFLWFPSTRSPDFTPAISTSELLQPPRSLRAVCSLLSTLQGHSEGGSDPSIRLGGRRKLFRSSTPSSRLSLTSFFSQHTLEAIEQGVTAVVDSDSDDFFLVVLTDANFERYGIEPADLKKVMNSNAKVKTCVATHPLFSKLLTRLIRSRDYRSLIAIGEGAEAEWLPSALPGKAHRVKNTSDIATTLRTILSSMLGGEL